MDIIDHAITQLGVSEATGQNDGTPADRYMAGDHLPWCAGFALWCIEAAGRKFWTSATDWYALRNVATLEQRCMHVGWWLPPGIVPLRCDLIFFGSRGGSDPGAGRHVGLVEAVDQNVVRTIEGNEGNAVRREAHDRLSQHITGYARLP